MSLAITSSPLADGGTRVVIEGEVDVSNAQTLTDALNTALDAEKTLLDVDMAQVPYIDSTGIGVLVAAAHRATEGGCEFTVSQPQPNVLRVLTLLGVGSEFHVHQG